MHVYADNAATTRMHQTAIDTMDEAISAIEDVQQTIDEAAQ